MPNRSGKISYLVARKISERVYPQRKNEKASESEDRRTEIVNAILEPRICADMYHNLLEQCNGDTSRLPPLKKLFSEEEFVALTGSKDVSSLTNDQIMVLLHALTWSRVINRPIKRKGHMIVDVCTPEGSIDRTIATKSKIIEQGGPLFYKGLKQLKWGDMFWL